MRDETEIEKDFTCSLSSSPCEVVCVVMSGSDMGWPLVILCPMRESTDDVPEISPPPVQWEGRVSWVVEVVVVVDELLRRVLQKLMNNLYENKNCNTGLEKSELLNLFHIFIPVNCFQSSNEDWYEEKAPTYRSKYFGSKRIWEAVRKTSNLPLLPNMTLQLWWDKKNTISI